MYQNDYYLKGGGIGPIPHSQFLLKCCMLLPTFRIWQRFTIRALRLIFNLTHHIKCCSLRRQFGDKWTEHIWTLRGISKHLLLIPTSDPSLKLLRKNDQELFKTTSRCCFKNILVPPLLTVPSRIRVSVAAVVPEVVLVVFTTLMVLSWSVVPAFGKPGLHGGRVNGYGVFDLKVQHSPFSSHSRLKGI